MIIDEVQREPDLILAIKSVVDRQRPAVRGQFVVTGSANLLMMKRIGDPLAGRACYLRLWPMTRREQLGLRTTGIWDRFFEENVVRWLFPEVAVGGGGLSPADRALWFDVYTTTYLERDLRDLAAVADLGDFQRLMQAAALRIGNLLNQSELGRDLKLTAMTVHRYLNLLGNFLSDRATRTVFSESYEAADQDAETVLEDFGPLTATERAVTF